MKLEKSKVDILARRNRILTNIAIANIAIAIELIRHVAIVVASSSEAAPTFCRNSLTGTGRADAGHY